MYVCGLPLAGEFNNEKTKKLNENQFHLMPVKNSAHILFDFGSFRSVELILIGVAKFSLNCYSRPHIRIFILFCFSFTYFLCMCVYVVITNYLAFCLGTLMNFNCCGQQHSRHDILLSLIILLFYSGLFPTDTGQKL